MSISNKKYYISSLKLITISLLLFLLFAFYDFSVSVPEMNFSITILIITYLEFIFCSIIILGLFRVYEKYSTYFIILAPAIPAISYSYVATKNMNDTNYLAIGIFFIIGYCLFIVLTKYSLDLISLNLNTLILGKDVSNCIGDDYRCISIYTKNIDNNQLYFIQSIIKNVLGYSKQKTKNILLDNNNYLIFEFTRKFSHSYIEHLILIPICCLDIGYLKWLDESDINEIPPISPLLTDIRSVDKQKNIYDYLGDYENEEVYKAFFIYQYFEDGDKLDQKLSFDGDVFLTLANLLVDHDRKIYRDENDGIIFDHIENENKIVESSSILHQYIVTYYKKDNLDSYELIKLRDKLCRIYIEEKYKPLIDVGYEFIDKMLKKKHIKTTSYFAVIFLIVVSIFFVIYNYTNDLVQTITVTVAIPAGLYSMVQLYDRFFQKFK